jgi:plastocyanin
MRGGVGTGMRGISSVLTLAAGLACAAPAAAADHGVAFRSYVYDANDVTVAVNDTVTFTGDAGETFGDHPLVWDGGQFTTTNSGSSKQFTFTQPGTYAYHCQFHVDNHGMKGVIRVAGDLHPAYVSFSVSPAAPIAGQPVTFTYTGDPDPDGALVRWEWDLDGDGTFETTTAAPTAGRNYPSAGTVTVRMRAIDNGNEASAIAEQAVAIAPARVPGSGLSTADTSAPRVTRVTLKGLTVSFRSTERATASAAVRVRGKLVAKGTAKAGRRIIHLRLTASGRRSLPRGKTVKATLSLTVRDSSANARTVKRRVTIKRA